MYSNSSSNEQTTCYMIPPKDIDPRAPSPAIPDQEELEPRFVPAEIMNASNRILPEKLILANGEPVGPSKNRPSFADDTPKPLYPKVPSNPAAILGAAEFAPGARPIRRHGSRHVFIDLSTPIPLTTEWKVEHFSPNTIEGTKVDLKENLPILPAPHETMMNSGESYTIRSTDSGKIISNPEIHQPVQYPYLSQNNSGRELGGHHF